MPDIDIYQYLDYRAFLRDYFAEQKAKRPSFGHEHFAARAGIKSSGFVLHVMKGERNLTKTVALGIARAIGLTRAQTEYFDDLVSFGQAKRQSDKEYYFDRITAKRKSVRAKPLDDRQYEFYSQWYHTVMRELVTLANGSSTPVKLAKLMVPAITGKQAKDSLKLQEELGILKKKKSGGYSQNDRFVSAGGPVRSTAIVKFQKEMLEHAKAAWDRFRTDEMTMHTITLCMSGETLERIRQEVREFKERLFEIVANEDKNPDRVFHLNLNLFPMTKSVIPHPGLSKAERALPVKGITQ